MNTPALSSSKLKIRPVQYRDLEAIAFLFKQLDPEQRNAARESLREELEQYQRFYGLLQISQFLPLCLDKSFSSYVAYQGEELLGMIYVSPFNKTRSTWKVEQVLLNGHTPLNDLLVGSKGIGSQLLRHCFEHVWEARTWILEVNVEEKNRLGLYRENGFQPLAQITNWCCSPEILAGLAQKNPDLPNLLPVSNADAKLLYQLDCVSMPPLLRQVFDRHIEDFKTGLISYIVRQLKHWLNQKEVVSAYVFEPQRKAAIGYFQLTLSQNGLSPHQAKLTVHPAYTWLYPQLLSQMARIVHHFPPQSLLLSSADYQPEKEEYLETLGAERIEHSLLMSRSVWHKLKESKPLEALSLPEVLQGLKPARTPIPSPWLKSILAPKERQPPSRHHQAPPPGQQNSEGQFHHE